MSKHRTRKTERWFRYPIYRRMVLSYGALVLILILVMGLLFMQVFARHSREMAMSYSTDMMAQRVYSTDILWEEMESLASSVGADSASVAFLNLRSDDKVIKYHAGQVLARSKALYSFVRNISLMNCTAGVAISTLNYGEDMEFFRSCAVSGARAWSARVIPGMSFRYPDLSVLSMVYPMRMDADGQVTAGVIIDLDQEHLQSMLQFTDVMPGASTVIVDSSGRVASATSKEAFLMPYAQEEYVARALSDDTGHGSFFISEHGEEKLVTWQRLSGNDWTVISVIPASDLLVRFNGIIYAIVAGLILLLIVALVAVYVSSRGVYSPIRELVDGVVDDDTLQSGNEIEAVARRINRIQQDSVKLRKTMHLTMVQHLLFGIPVSMEDKETPLKTASAFCVIALGLTEQQETQSGNDQMIIAAGNIAASMLQEICPCETAAWGNHAVLILCLSAKELPDAVPMTLEKVCDWCEETLHRHAIISISSLVSSPGRIHDAYLEAQQISQYAFYEPMRRIFTSDLIRTWESVQDIRVTEWSQKLAAEILDGNNQALPDSCRILMETLSACPPRQARLDTQNVLEQVMTRLSDSLPQEEWENYRSLCQSAQRTETWEELKHLFYTCIELFQKSAMENGQNLRSRRIVREICAYIQENYADPGLSLQSAAEKTGLSASYLGRMFKSQEQVTFTEYVTSVRLEEARHRLLETNSPIATIAHEVGLDNQSYFSSLFRKAYGVSPSAFRQTGR